MKKFVIYLLALTMILSPMTAFAAEGDPVEDEGQIPVEELQDQDAVVTEEAAPTEDAEAVEEAAPAAEEEAVETEESAEATEEAAPAAEEDAVVEEEPEVYLKAAAGDGETHPDGWNDDRSQYYKDNQPVEGLFKATMKNNVGALFYAYTEGSKKGRICQL